MNKKNVTSKKSGTNSKIANTMATANSPRKFAFQWVSIIVVLVLGIMVYANSFEGAFQLDDKHNITDNPSIRSLSNVKEMWDLNPFRFIAFYSFALNYHFGKLDISGYHWINLLIHLINSCLIGWLTSLIFSSPGMRSNPVSRYGNTIAFWVALLFVSHPLSTGSVTYIVQRMASMVAMFYFLTVALYFKGRLTNSKKKYIHYSGAAISFCLAILTKENAFTIPGTLFLVEMFFFRSINKMVNLRDYRLIILILGLISFIAISINYFSFSVFKPIPPSQFNIEQITSKNYFYTQLSVIVKYIQLLILPFSQNLDYDFPLSNSILDAHTLLSALILLLLLGMAIYLFNRNRLFSFGILWFFLTLSIESSIIPISDLIFEHRTYLPSFGYFLVLTSLIYHLLGAKNKTITVTLLCLLTGINSVLAYQRNKVWKDEITMWSDVISKSPNKARGYINRGYAYGNKGEWYKAIADFSKANEINPKFHAAAYYNIGFVYWNLGQKDKAIENYTMAIEVDSNYADAYYGRAVTYYYLNQPDSALSDYSKTIAVNNSYDKAYFSRGLLYANRNEWQNAIEDYSKAISINPAVAMVYYNRGIAFGNLGKWDMAFADFDKVITLEPNNTKAYGNREFAAKKMITIGNKSNP